MHTIVKPDRKVTRSVTSDVTIHFWGVRGGIACPGPNNARYGGNTSCVEINTNGHILIFDAGTGLRALGDALISKSKTLEVDIFYSHFHMDHVCGLPFFAPCYVPGNRIRFFAGELAKHQTTKEALGAMMAPPLFPIGIDEFRAQIEFCDFRIGQTLRPYPGVELKTALLNHPGGCVGYRLNCGGRSIAYITDTEHHIGELDENVLALANDADVMIYDCNYTDEEFSNYIGWGHSTWQQGIRLANEAKAEKLVLFHHDPKHTDDRLDDIGVRARRSKPGTEVAADGMIIRV